MSVSQTDRHAVAVHGTILGGELRRLLRSLSYNLAAVEDVIEYVGANGTCEGSAVEPEDLDAAEALIARHTTGLEYESAEDWPAWTDRDRWAASDSFGRVDG